MFTKRFSAVVTVALCTMLAACGGNNEENNVDPNNMTTNVDPNNMTTNVDPNNMTTNVDPNNCAGVSNCDTPGSTCMGDSAVVCAADANGCLVETTTDCAASDQVCMGGACMDPGMCMDDPACAGMNDGQRFCTGDTLTLCSMNADGCLEATTTDCAAAGQTCEMDTQTCVDPCTDDPACDGLNDGDTYCDGNGYVTCAANAQGCLEPATTACNAGEVCDATGGTAMCAMACPEASQTFSCADAGMTIMADTAAGTSVVTENGCDTGTYDANELFFVFTDAADYDVSIDFTYDNANISAVDAFALAADGVCTDPSLTCEAFDFGFGSGTLDFGAAAGETYYLLFEPWNTTETTPIGFTITCTAPVCGDGVIGAGEECDDMNTTPGDGCDANCAVEAGWLCDDEPSICIEEICGDGVITLNEECDDNNTTDGDGCDANCAVEMDYICTGEPSTCVPDVCGDGTLSPNEQCDDAGTVDGDGCSATCEVEFGWECDDTGANCMMFPSIGSFAPGDAIADSSLTVAQSECETQSITFSDTVVLDGGVTGTSGDPDLYVYSEDATYVQEESIGGTSESFSGVVVPAGTYLVTVCGYDADDTYTVSFSTAALSSTDIGTFAAAAAIADQTGALTDGDTVFYEITFSDHVFVSGTLTADTGNANLRIMWSSGAPIANLATSGDETLTDLALPAGTYLLAVQAAAGDGDIGTYTLGLSTTALPTTDIGTFAAGDAVADTVGGLLAAGESVYYTITFSTDVSLTGSLTATSTGDPDLVAYSSMEFGFGSFADGDESFTDQALTAGTYLIRIDAYAPAGDVDGFTLVLDPN